MLFFSHLSQTNLQFNNNKYYLIQLLEDDAQKNFSVWMRWGRGKARLYDGLFDSHSETQKSVKGSGTSWAFEVGNWQASLLGSFVRLRRRPPLDWRYCLSAGTLSGTLYQCDLLPKPLHLSHPLFLPIGHTISRETLERWLVTAGELYLGSRTRNHPVFGLYFAVGKTGQHSLVACSGDLNKAKEIFQKK